ncbi:glycoside hydrolase family 78 protein [Baudoinia panamericana UAMH 10762]|uniref:alpha-L-rhamnosidase n=1 Tax=Baudoinia panamericana (strain UAMH 10762) TaxID=717646 RepID=M2MJS0_BAUPA|nr:glycoside hydrolase family 78 protein [Baudoinia panamericana UAMH 10762]EMC91568.1 glycoside hydrolase family 78 protein [Baudoinia panamericana UAMH 10762]
MSQPSLSKPTFEHHHSGLGLDCARPRISWRFTWPQQAAPPSAWSQTRYEIEVLLDGDHSANVFKVESSQSVLVPWPTAALLPQQSATVRVRCFGGRESDDHEGSTEWSESAQVETALLKPDLWKAQFITSASRSHPPTGPLRPLRFRKTFDLPASGSKVLKARLYITALGVFDVYVDGVRATDELLAPGWTSYKHRLTYRTMNVTSLLQKSTGKHALCVEVAEGWYCGRLGFLGGQRYLYGHTMALLAQLEVTLDNGEAEPLRICSDDTWRCADSAIERSEFYDGETYDARQEWNWNSALASQDDRWRGTRKISWPETKLVCPQMPPVRVTETLQPKEIFKTPSGKTIVDFGQNMVGKVLIKSMRVPKNHTVTLRHAEVMEHDELGTRPLRQAQAEDTYISSGEECKDWTPAFTFHGFRYVQIDGWEPTESEIAAVVMSSDMPRRGWFSCSNSWVNKLHENVLWSMRGNFLSIPTDCPQRDERLGWTGDIQVFAPSACFLYDTTSFLSSWLEDVMAEQLEEGKGGIPPLVVPIIPLGNWPHMPQAVWDDVTVLTPMDVFSYSGDTAILERQLPSMQAWLDEAIDRGEDGLWTRDRWQLADWLDPGAPPEDPGASRTDNVLVADAYLIHVTRTMATVCSQLGRTELAQKYTADSERLRSHFQHKYITPAGYLMSNTQTGLALAIHFDLYPSTTQLAVAAKELATQVQSAKFHISTGFAGTPIISHALTETHQTQLAYRMLLETTCPSWLYPIRMGATTIWERWNSMLEDGSVNPGEMTSFNHYALGSVADWLHKTVGGISPAEPGWRVIRVRPVPGGNLTHAAVSFEGPYGLVSCSWKLTSKAGPVQDGSSSSAAAESYAFEMELTVPPNSSAVVTLPSELKRSLSDSGEETQTVVKSGRHVFTCEWEPAPWPPKALLSADLRPGQPTIADGPLEVWKPSR